MPEPSIRTKSITEYSFGFIRETLNVCKIGTRTHQNFPQEFIVDPSHLTNGGAPMQDWIQLDLGNCKGYIFEIVPTCGRKFSINNACSITYKLLRQTFDMSLMAPDPKNFYSTITLSEVSLGNLSGHTYQDVGNYFWLAKNNKGFYLGGTLQFNYPATFDSIFITVEFKDKMEHRSDWYRTSDQVDYDKIDESFCNINAPFNSITII